MSTTIYQAPTTNKKQSYHKLAFLSLFVSLSIFSLFLLLPTLAKIKSKAAPKTQSPDYFADLIAQNIDWEILKDFQLIIPKLNLNIPVTPSVDPNNPQSWKTALKQGVAHAQGTSFPDQSGTIYIFGHSTDYPWNIETYNALFYSLNDLQENDHIYLSFQKQPYRYQVVQKLILEADDLSFLNSSEDQLILQTCWPPGTTYKRLTIKAQPIDF